MASLLPQVPVKHRDFVNYIQSHPNVAIEELAMPYNNYDAAAGEIFAQEPSHPFVTDNQANIVPLYNATGTTDIRIWARDLASETPEQKEKYLLPLSGTMRRSTGSSAVVPTLDEFQKNFAIFTEGTLGDLNWDNVVAAGSAVVTPLLPLPERYRKSKRGLQQYYHDEFAPASDVDLFLYGLTDDEAIEKIKHIEETIKNSILHETTTVRTKHAITIASQYPSRPSYLQTIYERSFKRTKGLARLLVLENLPNSDDRAAYLEQRRAERGRPLNQYWRRQGRQLRGNLKDDWEDEIPEWQEEDQVFNYHTFTIPYGRQFNARKIEKLLYTRDLLLNTQWNQPKESLFGPATLPRP